jgi:hypothetical protein
MNDGFSQFQNLRAITRGQIVAKRAVTRFDIGSRVTGLHQEADVGANPVPGLLQVGFDESTCFPVKWEAQKLMTSIDVTRLAQKPVPPHKVIGLLRLRGSG